MLALTIVCISNSLLLAGSKYWVKLIDWSISFDNNVAYINASNMPVHCSYSRAEIDPNATSLYYKYMFAYLLSAYSMGKTTEISIVLDQNEAICKCYGADAPR